MSQPLIKSSQLDNLPILDQAQKKQYKEGLDKLWAEYESAPQGSTQRNNALQRITAASQKIMSMLTNKNRPGSAAQVQRPSQTGQAANGQGDPMQQNQNAQRPVQAPAQPQQGQNAQQSGEADAATRARISAEVNAMTIYPLPEHTTAAQYEQHKTTFKSSFASYRYKVEKAKESLANIQRQFQQLQAAGQPISQEMRMSAQRTKSAHDQLQQQVTMLMEQNNRAAQAVAARKAHAGQPNRQTPVNDTTRPVTQQGQQPQEASSATPVQSQAPLNMPQNATQARPPQQQPSNAAAQAPRPVAQQGPPQPQQPQRPPVNAQTSQQYPNQYAGTPTSALPQSAVAPPQRPHALSQQATFAKAQEQNVGNPQQAMSAPQQQAANGFGAAPSQSTPVTPNPTQTAMNSKFPIPKTLNLGAQTQTPVPGANPRPTMMNHGGMMGVPGIQKAPPFTLEGEGDHVLSKRKLDELVRQVTGSSNPSDGLTPEVEEAVLSLTDEFVDNVITKACQMAKLRQGQTLEVRDIQIVLERNYGIRIPGHSLDEVRAVRKFQPGAGWIAKVQAVQAGKVMGNNRDA